MVATPDPVVAIWKSTWLPPSQTFIQHQVGALRRWRPLLLGIRRLPDGLPVVPDLAPFGSSRPWHVAQRLSAASGYLGVYDRVLRIAKPQLMHAHFGTGAVSVLPVARRRRIPLVVTFHGYDVTLEPLRGDDAGRRYRRGLTRVFEYADTLIAVSDFLAARLVTLGAPEAKIRVHHIGIPVTDDEPPGNDRVGITFVGRLVDVKGVQDLIAAVARLDPPHRDVPVRIIGDGENRSSLEHSAASHGLNVTFLGFRDSREVADELRRSAIFCAPSKTAAGGYAEAFGTVFLEAALHGLPVVSYRHGGIPEAVVHGRTGLLAPEGDVSALAACLDSLLADPSRAAELGRAGRQRVVRDFDVLHQTALLEDLYDDVAARARARRGAQ